MIETLIDAPQRSKPKVRNAVRLLSRRELNADEDAAHLRDISQISLGIASTRRDLKCTRVEANKVATQS